MKPIPKSLHTVTVLQRLAVYIAKEENRDSSTYLPPEDCVEAARYVLGLSDMDDTYGLVQQAKAQIIRNASSK